MTEYWRPPDIHASGRRALAPEPPAALLLRKLEWFADPEAFRHAALREPSRLALNTLRALPEWPKARSKAERRAAMHRAFIEPAEAFDPGTSGNLVFAGPTGTGKTLGAVHALFAMWERGFETYQAWPEAMFVKATDIANARRNGRLGDEPAILEKARTVGLLLLDDIGQGEDRDTALFEVVDARYDLSLPTVATTGLRSEEFAERLGEVLLRRLVQAGRAGKFVSAFAKPKLKAVV